MTVFGLSSTRRVLGVGLAALIIAAVATPMVWARWQTHQQSVARADARALADNFAFAASDPSLPQCPSGSDPDTQFVGCYFLPYVPQQELISDVMHAFAKAGVHVSGHECTPHSDGLTPGIQLCEVWVKHGDWYARATFTSTRQVPTPAQLRRAQAKGLSLTTFMASERYRPWTGAIAVSRDH